ncbi:MAG: hypothetical protein LBN34_05770 [Clostridiales Family XIII bacterium]|jgi:hypothetical protein|nr:hypothetical protein [Clostridiales Family XIII bacterium]
MSFWNWLTGDTANISNTPILVSQMPMAAIDEIRNGRLAILKTQRLIMKQSEELHYFDPAILVVEKKHKRYVRRGGGASFQGLFGIRHYMGKGQTDVVEDEYTEQIHGILYITNKRIIFQSTTNGFDKLHTKLSAINPYSNAIELQYDTKSFRLFVPDGNVISQVVTLVT